MNNYRIHTSEDLIDSKEIYSDSVRRNSPSSKRPLATPQSRIVAFLIDLTLFGLTFGVGWLIWFFMIADRGTTPGHDLMGQHVVSAKTGEPLSLGKMVLREIFLKGIFATLFGSMTMFINYLVDAGFMFRSDRRSLHDLVLGSEVVQARSSTLFDKLQNL